MVGIVAYGLFAENASLWVPGVVSDPGGMRVSWADPGLVLTELTNKQAGTAQCWESEGRPVVSQKYPSTTQVVLSYPDAVWTEGNMARRRKHTSEPLVLSRDPVGKAPG